MDKGFYTDQELNAVSTSLRELLGTADSVLEIPHPLFPGQRVRLNVIRADAEGNNYGCSIFVTCGLCHPGCSELMSMELDDYEEAERDVDSVLNLPVLAEGEDGTADGAHEVGHRELSGSEQRRRERLEELGIEMSEESIQADHRFELFFTLPPFLDNPASTAPGRYMIEALRNLMEEAARDTSVIDWDGFFRPKEEIRRRMPFSGLLMQHAVSPEIPGSLSLGEDRVVNLLQLMPLFEDEHAFMERYGASELGFRMLGRDCTVNTCRMSHLQRTPLSEAQRLNTVVEDARQLEGHALLRDTVKNGMNAYNALAALLQWCMHRHMMSDAFTEEHAEALQSFYADPLHFDTRSFIRDRLDGVLMLYDFSPDVRLFINLYCMKKSTVNGTNYFEDLENRALEKLGTDTYCNADVYPFGRMLIDYDGDYVKAAGRELQIHYNMLAASRLPGSEDLTPAFRQLTTFLGCRCIQYVSKLHQQTRLPAEATYFTRRSFVSAVQPVILKTCDTWPVIPKRYQSNVLNMRLPGHEELARINAVLGHEFSMEDLERLKDLIDRFRQMQEDGAKSGDKGERQDLAQTFERIYDRVLERATGASAGDELDDEFDDDDPYDDDLPDDAGHDADVGESSDAEERRGKEARAKDGDDAKDVYKSPLAGDADRHNEKVSEEELLQDQESESNGGLRRDSTNRDIFGLVHDTYPDYRQYMMESINMHIKEMSGSEIVDMISQMRRSDDEIMELRAAAADEHDKAAERGDSDVAESASAAPCDADLREDADADADEDAGARALSRAQDASAARSERSDGAKTDPDPSESQENALADPCLEFHGFDKDYNPLRRLFPDRERLPDFAAFRCAESRTQVSDGNQAAYIEAQIERDSEGNPECMFGDDRYLPTFTMGDLRTRHMQLRRFPLLSRPLPDHDAVRADLITARQLEVLQSDLNWVTDITGCSTLGNYYDTKVQPQRLMVTARDLNVFLALIPSNKPWDVLGMFPGGAWNRYTDTLTFMSLYRHWHIRHKIRLISLSRTEASFRAFKKIDYADGLEIAKECFCICPAVLQNCNLSQFAVHICNGDMWILEWDPEHVTDPAEEEATDERTQE